LAALAAWAIGVAPAGGEQASQSSSVVAGWLDAGRFHTCSIVPPAQLRRWGVGIAGALGLRLDGDDRGRRNAGHRGPG
jgi:hypothetical protein